MEAQLQDINNRTTLNSLKQLRGSIVDCAKSIRSNDATFRISLLSSAGEKLTGLMGKYIEAVHRVEACQSAFLKVKEFLEENEGDSEVWTGDFSDLTKLSEIIDKRIEEESQNMTTSEIDAQLELDKIIRPYLDEEVQMEAAPSRQIPKDPITKKDIKIAVKSNVCGHIYDKEGIEDYFKQKEQAKKTARCPQAGCTNKTMSRSELVLDEETNKLIQSL